ncbi:MAG: CPBP family intramembrane glutamic endopeptidase [Deltaproteobacteria bacterium]|nr:CPBP family intramembrane glutamic endopeptidase [Deltaproteobacteria bacterium]
MSSPSAKWSRATLVLVLYLGLGAAGFAWARLRGQPNVWRYSGQAEPQVALGLLMGLFLGLGFVFVSRLTVHRFEWARALHRDFRARLYPMATYELLVLAGASSLGEEVFFRGSLLPVVGVWGSSLLFALLHIGPRVRYLPWTLSSLLAGLVFGQLFVWSGDLSGPVLAHFTVNYLNLGHLRDHDLR